MTVHLRLDGTWAECEATQRACPRTHHLPAITLEQAELVPLPILEQLLGERIGGQPTIHHGIGSHTIEMWRDAEKRQHRDYDLPAIIGTDGEMKWYQHGKLHREGDKPAVIYADGTQEWYMHGKRHREGGPARLEPNGTQSWLQDDVQHREDGPAEIEVGMGEFWYYRGLPHRGDGGPSHTYYGSNWREWWVAGELIRAEEA